MIQFVVGAAAGYIFGTKAGRKRYHQIKGAYEKAINSPVTKNAVNATRKAVANKLDPEPRMKEVKDLSRGRRIKGNQLDGRDRLYEPDEDCDRRLLHGSQRMILRHERRVYAGFDGLVAIFVAQALTDRKQFDGDHRRFLRGCAG